MTIGSSSDGVLDASASVHVTRSACASVSACQSSVSNESNHPHTPSTV